AAPAHWTPSAPAARLSGLLHTACCGSTTAPASSASPSRWPDPLARTFRVAEWPLRISSGCTAPFPMPLKRARCLAPFAWLFPERLAPLSSRVSSDPTGPAHKARWDYWERVSWPGPGLSPPHPNCRLAAPACPGPVLLAPWARVSDFPPPQP